MGLAPKMILNHVEKGEKAFSPCLTLFPEDVFLGYLKTGDYLLTIKSERLRTGIFVLDGQNLNLYKPHPAAQW